MGNIQQSGNITPGHLATWTTDGVIQDGGVAPASVIASLKNANFSITTDQPIVIPQNIVAFQITAIVITNAPVSLTTAVGGFYPQSGKAGTPIVSSAQAYSALSTQASLMQATLAAFGSGTRFSSANLGTVAGLLAVWFSLTTPQAVNATADIYIIGNNMS